MILLCETCGAEIASIDKKTLCQPITGKTLLPLTPEHPDIFPNELPWEYIKCPMCQYRPFELPNKILTKIGYFEVPKKVEQAELKYKKKGHKTHAKKQRATAARR